MKSTLLAIIHDFKSIFIAYGIIFVICGLLFVISSFYPDVIPVLSTSRSTLWGIITSIFVHSSLSHFANNMITLFFFMFLFAISNYTLLIERKKSAERFFLVSSFVLAIVSNILWIFISPTGAVGASGLVYATEGIVFGFSFIRGFGLLNYKKFRTQKPPVQLSVFLNLAIFLGILTEIFLEPAAFLSVGPGVNVYEHFISFYVGFVIAVFFYLIHKIPILE